MCHQRTTSSTTQHFINAPIYAENRFFLLRLVPATRLHNLSEWTFHSSKMDEFLEKCWWRAGENTATVSLVRTSQEKDQSRECAKYIILTCESFAIRLWWWSQQLYARIAMEGAIEKVVQTHFFLRLCTEINLLAQPSIKNESKRLLRIMLQNFIFFFPTNLNIFSLVARFLFLICCNFWYYLPSFTTL